MKTAVFDVQKIRKDFPLLSRPMNGAPLVYLDNAASTQKPVSVIERMSTFLKEEYANVHRGIYTLSQKATDACELSREKCRRFLNAEHVSEIIFVRGATEAINLVATGFGERFLKEGDEILVSAIEHHSNIVPWQELCRRRGLTLRVIPVNDRGELDLEVFSRLLNPRTYLVAVTHVSNALGTVNPVKEIIKMAHHAGAVVLVDGAQSAPHLKIDVRDLDCDFFCLSGHKVYGPTGIGVLYGKSKHLESMNPYQFGGDMIETVSFEKTTYLKPPHKFEAGTPAIAEIIGLGSAIDYLDLVGLDQVASYEHELLVEATQRLSEIPGLRIIGTAEEKASLVSFDLQGIHPHDVGTILNEYGVAVRAGNHCAMPTMKRFGVAATTRASFAFYNTKEEIQALVKAVNKAREILGG